MLTKALRLHGANDLRLDTFEISLPDDGILASVISDSLCVSTKKALDQGPAHWRVPDDLDFDPVIVGHELCGVIEEVGERWKGFFEPGEMFTLQPARDGVAEAPGYSYSFCGGDATKIIIPCELIESGCLIKYRGDGAFRGSLTEPLSCVLAALRSSYHLNGRAHEMGIKKGGKTILLGGAGTMGLCMVNCVLSSDRRPELLVAVDTDPAKLSRASRIIPPSEAEKLGTRLIWLNPANFEKPEESLKRFAGGSYDDAFIFAPDKGLISLADRLLGDDGCLNFFAGPNDAKFSAELNLYNIHYRSRHIVGTSGGDAEDMRDALSAIEYGRVDPAFMVTHICGLDGALAATKSLDKLPGAKKLCYPGISLPLTALSDLEKLGKSDKFLAGLAGIIKKTNGLWSVEAEKYLLQNARSI